jgi:hypothetical protein
MQKRSSIGAKNVVVSSGTDEATLKNQAAVLLGRLGGMKGGPARAAKLSPKRRAAIAKKAAKARWSKEPPTNGKS